MRKWDLPEVSNGLSIRQSKVLSMKSARVDNRIDLLYNNYYFVRVFLKKYADWSISRISSGEGSIDDGKNGHSEWIQACS